MTFRRRISQKMTIRIRIAVVLVISQDKIYYLTGSDGGENRCSEKTMGARPLFDLFSTLLPLYAALGPVIPPSVRRELL